MNYTEYLFEKLLCIYDGKYTELEYDIAYDYFKELFQLFNASIFNDDKKPLYECIINYLINVYGKTTKMI